MSLFCLLNVKQSSFGRITPDSSITWSLKAADWAVKGRAVQKCVTYFSIVGLCKAVPVTTSNPIFSSSFDLNGISRDGDRSNSEITLLQCDLATKMLPRTTSKHGLHRFRTLTKRSNVFKPKSGCASIRCPPGSTAASPQVAARCVEDFLVANSTFAIGAAEETGPRLLFQHRFFRWRSSVLKLKSRLRQTHAVHTAAHKLRHQLLNLRSRTSLGS